MSRLLRTILIVLGLTIALTSAGLGLLMAQDQPAAAVVARKTASVLVASRQIPAGHRIEKADLAWKDIASSAVPSGALARPDHSELTAIGSIALQNLAPGQVIGQSDLTRPSGAESLAGNLNPGWRAVTFEADASQMSAGMLMPNDKVDLFLAVATAQAVAIPNPLPFGKTSGAGLGSDSTTIANVRVIAINGAMRASGGGGAAIGKSSGTITLELRPEQVAAVLGAAASGRLGIALRSRFDTAMESATGDVAKQPAAPLPKARAANTGAPKPAQPVKIDAARPAPDGVIIIRGWEKTRAN